MSDKIVRGTTRTIRLRFKPEQLEVENIKDIYLAVMQGPDKVLHFFGQDPAAWQLDAHENTAAHKFTQEETLALKSGIRMYLEVHVLDIYGSRSEAFAGTYQVEDTAYPEVMT